MKMMDGLPEGGEPDCDEDMANDGNKEADSVVMQQNGSETPDIEFENA